MKTIALFSACLVLAGALAFGAEKAAVASDNDRTAEGPAGSPANVQCAAAEPTAEEQMDASLPGMEETPASATEASTKSLPDPIAMDGVGPEIANCEPICNNTYCRLSGAFPAHWTCAQTPYYTKCNITDLYDPEGCYTTICCE